MKVNRIYNLMPFLLFVSIIINCARIGSPTGGKKDIVPPDVIKYNPNKFQTNILVNLNKIELNFNEYVVLNNTEQIIFAPSFKNQPNFKPIGLPTKKITITLNDKLDENTTYSINFGNSISDNNEGNSLPYFNYVFTTGTKIDSLEITGKINETFLKKESGKDNYIAGLYEINNQFKDSIIIKSKPKYLSKVDSINNFKLSNLKKEAYKLIVFNDLNKNSIYDEGSENFGFSEKNIELTENKNIEVNINEFTKKYKLKEIKSTSYGKLNFVVEGEINDIKLEAIDKKITLEKLNYYSDSINYWYNPEKNELNNSLKFKVTNLKLNKIDTLTCLIKKYNKPELKISFKNNLDKLEENIALISNTPINDSIKQKITLFKLKNKDSIVVPFDLIGDKLDSLMKLISLKKELNTNYVLIINKNSIKDIFGNTNRSSIIENFSSINKNKLASVKLLFNNQLKLPFIYKLYNERNELIKEQYLSDSTKSIEINNLSPEKYSILILIDENRDGIWNKGNYFKNIIPEKTFIFKQIIQARPLWLSEQEIIIPKEN